MSTLAHLLQAIPTADTEHLSPAVLASEVAQIAVDSRQVVPGSVFVAVPGAKADGRRFIPEAIARGCLAVVVEGNADKDEWPIPLVRVTDCRAALSDLAAAWYGFPAERMQLVGITGTNGKTTCSWLIEGMLAAAGYRPGVIGTVNYRYHDGKDIHILQDAPLTTPDPLTLQRMLRVMADAGVTHVIMEVSSHALDQQRLGRTSFAVALFTNLSRDHLDYHRTVDEYFAAKNRLFRHHLQPDGTAVVVSSPEFEGIDWGAALCRTITDREVLRCGLGPECEVRADEVVQSVEGVRCRLDLKGRSMAFSSHLAGRYNLLNVLAAAGAGMALGLSEQQIGEGLAAVRNIPGRLERVRLPGAPAGSEPAVFVDYAHTPDALDNVLATLGELTAGRLICVFGCGGDRDRGKRPQMGAIALRHAQVAIVTSDNPRTEQPGAIIDEIVAGMATEQLKPLPAAALLCGTSTAKGFAVIENRRKAIAAACSLAAPGDTALIAGKGHENYQILGTTKHFFDDGLEAANGLLRWNERHLLAATGGRVAAGSQQAVLHDISTDTRTLEPGDVFVALTGETFDGHAYIETAVERGAAAVIAERMPVAMREDVLYITVADSLRALGDLAAYRRRLLSGAVKVAAVTGSSGKTTVKEMVAAIFAQALASAHAGIDPLLKTRGNFNNLVGLPLSLLPIDAGHRLAIVEMGMNVPGEIARLTAIADPDVGCINNVHPAHLQGLGSVAGVAAAKGELFAGMRADAVRVVNCDDPQVLAQAAKSGGAQIGFAVTAAGRRHRPLIQVTRQENLGELGMRFTLHIGSWRRRLTVPVFGGHNVSNCAAAAAIAHAAAIGSEIIAAGLEGYAPAVDKRLAIGGLPGGLKVVNDAYNANPASMAAGLRTVAAFGGTCRHVAALGDMLELGEASAQLHAGIGALAAQLQYDYLFAIGTQAPHTIEAALAGGMRPEQVRICPNLDDMAATLCQLLTNGGLGRGDWLFIKGSRGMRMERLLDQLEQRLQTNQ
ncbi:UDP-N-acetylmuramoyl-L-alanyl-D-glutamate--2,6-diaminopimelate ligase [Desulfobulbus sp.]|uniref:UDP-N-acetylmuramoyl-L-alanyl-D-glutamate--2, 6-diaminopimelate ligase n=1 Tax=Desulfobulbus sp. TaxID=895 RepID=UPI00286EFAB0|nr:UDP-N-acetylmuramoyl-L-alanyl-D-glutamate--2,6-diaminopimelate ligase [Desulfobulbus sp.]